MIAKPFQETEQWSAYKSIISNEVFDCVNSQTSVLEIGPFHGAFTDLLLEKNPKRLFLIEPNKHACAKLAEKYSARQNVLVSSDNVFDMLNQARVGQFDVVVAFGVLYHWHNPFDFFERVANFVKPKFFLIDAPGVKDIYLSQEELNVPGSRQVAESWRTVQLSLCVPAKYIKSALNDLGYNADFYRSMSDINLNTKNQFDVWKFRINDSLCQR